MEQIISPYGGQLVNLIASPERSAELKQAALAFASLDINWQQQCDLELLLNGGYSPLTGYMGQADYVSVLQNLRLADGRAWPLPLCLQVSAAQADKIKWVIHWRCAMVRASCWLW